MKIESIETLHFFLENHTAEEILETFEAMDKSTVINLKRLVEYNRRLREGLKDADEIQQSIKYSSFFILAGAIATFALSWWFKEPLHTFIATNRWVVPIIPTYLYVAIANIYDFFGKYDLIKRLDIRLGQDTFTEEMIEAYNEEEEEQDGGDEEEQEEQEEQTKKKITKLEKHV
jgi:hypothetical protein